LKAFSERYGGTMFSTTFAACVAMLHRRTGVTDIAMWTPLAGRSQPELENLVGLFVNQTAIRVDLSDDPSLTRLAARVRDEVWEALAHQVVPFESVIEALPENDKPREGQFCSVNFVCQRAFGGAVNSEFDFPDVRVSPVPSKSPGALYDLNFFLVERAEGWRLSLEYSSDLYSAETAGRLIDGFDSVLRMIVSSPDIKLSEHGAELKGTSSSLPQSEDASTEVATSPEDSCEFSASVSQLRFWKLSRLRSDSAAFNMPSTVRVEGPLSVELLQKSLVDLVERHESLRTTFRERDGELTQIISSEANCELHLTDLREVSRQSSFDLDSLLSEEAQDLSQEFDCFVWRPSATS
jgi:non-ribosomal peptide synthetase component F